MSSILKTLLFLSAVFFIVFANWEHDVALFMSNFFSPLACIVTVLAVLLTFARKFVWAIGGVILAGCMAFSLLSSDHWPTPQKFEGDTLHFAQFDGNHTHFDSGKLLAWLGHSETSIDIAYVYGLTPEMKEKFKDYTGPLTVEKTFIEDAELDKVVLSKLPMTQPQTSHAPRGLSFISVTIEHPLQDFTLIGVDLAPLSHLPILQTLSFIPNLQKFTLTANPYGQSRPDFIAGGLYLAYLSHMNQKIRSLGRLGDYRAWVVREDMAFGKERLLNFQSQQLFATPFFYLKSNTLGPDVGGTHRPLTSTLIYRTIEGYPGGAM